MPTGFEKYTVGFEVGGYHFNATIWDTSGALTYDNIRPLTYQNADVFLICFHLGDYNSLQNALNKWYPEVHQYSSSSVPVILCGCQSDMRFAEIPATVASISGDVKKRPVFSEEALAISRQIGAITYVETTSFYNNRTAQEAFEVSALAAKGKLNNNSKMKPSSSTNLTRHRSLFKLRKCKSKGEFKEDVKKCTIM